MSIGELTQAGFEAFHCDCAQIDDIVPQRDIMRDDECAHDLRVIQDNSGVGHDTVAQSCVGKGLAAHRLTLGGVLKVTIAGIVEKSAEFLVKMEACGLGALVGLQLDRREG
jgi:hypothetical protein